MKKGTFISVGLIVSVFTVGLVGSVSVDSTVHADDHSHDTHKVKKDDKAKKQDKKSSRDYTYVANAGDSYTQMVRKAVQTYGINNHVDLGNARIVYIETNMTQVANEPYLIVGQSVTIKKNDVKSWVKKSQNLSDSQLAAWQSYVPYIDFNTDKVGE